MGISHIELSQLANRLSDWQAGLLFSAEYRGIDIPELLDNDKNKNNGKDNALFIKVLQLRGHLQLAEAVALEMQNLIDKRIEAGETLPIWERD